MRFVCFHLVSMFYSVSWLRDRGGVSWGGVDFRGCFVHFVNDIDIGEVKVRRTWAQKLQNYQD